MLLASSRCLGALHLLRYVQRRVSARLQTRSASIFGAGNNPVVGATVAVAVAVEESSK